MNAEQAKQARTTRRAAAGALYGVGVCHWCGFKVPAKALWCCGECAKDYEAETRQLAVKAAVVGAG